MTFPISAQDYEAEIKEIVTAALSELGDDADDDDVKDSLMDATREHEWAIYTGKAICVLFHSKNDDAYFEDFGDGGILSAVKDGWGMLYTVCAAYAMYRDCLEELERQRDNQ